MPPGVINMLPGDGLDVSKVALTHPDLAGIHFTGSTPTFQHLWRTVGENIAGYRSYPRIVGETGGKDFVVAHPSADPDVLRVALIRGAFEFQGQKCSAASRAYVARSVWTRCATTSCRGRGDPDGRRHRLLQLHGRGHRRPRVRQAQGGDRPGHAQQAPHHAGRRPGRRLGRLLRAADRRPVHRPDRPDVHHRVLRPDPGRARLRRRATTRRSSPDGVVRAVRPDRRDHRPGPAGDRLGAASCAFAAGNFYINDKPTGAVVGQQPFGGGRASGTNDKAGAAVNLLRWTSPRSIKETFVPKWLGCGDGGGEMLLGRRDLASLC